jgi:hypothetical protein
MKKKLEVKYRLFIIAFVFIDFFSAQNLVPNGDFEDYFNCPASLANLIDPSISGMPRSPKHWFDPINSSSDYFNSCSIVSDLTGVPCNEIGCMNAHSGDGYCGFGFVLNGEGETSNHWEYIEVKLTNELSAGTIYCCRYWLVSAKNTCYHINNIGIVISSDSIAGTAEQFLNYSTAQVNSQILTETNVWTEIEFNYTAIGGEKFLTIGVFDTIGILRDQTCDAPEWLLSYYYVDDVSLVMDSCSKIQDPVSPNEPSNPEVFDNYKIPNVVTPNNDGINDVWYINSNVELSLI